MLPRLTLVVSFRETGWRRPLRDPVALEVWSTPDAQLLVILPASYLEELVRAHLSLEVQQRLGTFVAPPEAPSPPLTPVPPPTSSGPPPKLRGPRGRRLRRLNDK